VSSSVINTRLAILVLGDSRGKSASWLSAVNADSPPEGSIGVWKTFSSPIATVPRRIAMRRE
jgi:hypothetical protein